MNHKEIEAALDKIKKKMNQQVSQEIMDAIQHSTVIVPAVMPKDTDPGILRQMLKNQALPKGANPQPCFLENKEGESVLPIFTSEEEMRRSKNAPAFPLLLHMDFSECMKLVLKHKKLSGIVINPFTHNIILRPNKNNRTVGQEQKTASPQQYHFMKRQQLEAFLLPKQLFEKKEAFMKEMIEKKGDYIKELYDTLYDAELACPYTADDFDCMFLNIREDLMVGQITMPQKYLMEKTCPIVFLAWDTTQEQFWYYAVVLVGAKAEPHLFEVHEDGKNTDLGKAPAEGSELSTVINLIQGAENDRKEP